MNNEIIFVIVESKSGGLEEKVTPNSIFTDAENFEKLKSNIS